MLVKLFELKKFAVKHLMNLVHLKKNLVSLLSRHHLYNFSELNQWKYLLLCLRVKH